MRLFWVWLIAVITLGVGIVVGAITAPVTRTLLSGPLAVIPKTCGAGALYTATDQPLGQQIYVCGGGSAWFQLGSLGKSGGLVIVKGVLDINPNVVAQVHAANMFTALQMLQAGLSLKTASVMPDCTNLTDGLLWHQSGNTSPVSLNGVKTPLTKDSVSVCVFTGEDYGWFALY